MTIISKDQFLELKHLKSLGVPTTTIAKKIGISVPNAATYCGYTAVHNAGMSGMMAVLGSAMATFALVLPSLVLMILISKMLYKYMKTSAVQSIFIGLRPAIVGLVGAAALLLMNGENFSTPANPWHFYISIALFFATFIGVKVMKINPIRMILYSAFAGLVLLY